MLQQSMRRYVRTSKQHITDHVHVTDLEATHTCIELLVRTYQNICIHMFEFKSKSTRMDTFRILKSRHEERLIEAGTRGKRKAT